MNKQEKLTKLKLEHLKEFLDTRESVFRELSDKQTMFCCCGRIATGMHERYCGKFNNKVDSETIKRLDYLLH